MGDGWSLCRPLAAWQNEKGSHLIITRKRKPKKFNNRATISTRSNSLKSNDKTTKCPSINKQFARVGNENCHYLRNLNLHDDHCNHILVAVLWLESMQKYP